MNQNIGKHISCWKEIDKLKLSLDAHIGMKNAAIKEAERIQSLLNAATKETNVWKSEINKQNQEIEYLKDLLKVQAEENIRLAGLVDIDREAQQFLREGK